MCITEKRLLSDTLRPGMSCHALGRNSVFMSQQHLFDKIPLTRNTKDKVVD